MGIFPNLANYASSDLLYPTIDVLEKSKGRVRNTYVLLNRWNDNEFCADELWRVRAYADKRRIRFFNTADDDLQLVSDKLLSIVSRRVLGGSFLSRVHQLR